MKIKTLGEKIMLISKYDSQFAIRAIPDYEPVCMGTLISNVNTTFSLGLV